MNSLAVTEHTATVMANKRSQFIPMKLFSVSLFVLYHSILSHHVHAVQSLHSLGLSCIIISCDRAQRKANR